MDGATMGALHTLADDGTRSDIPLLRHLALTEQREIREPAVSAISQIRTRQREDQRTDWARKLPNYSDLQTASRPFASLGLGPKEARCASYAHLVLGARSMPRGDHWGEPETYLALGEPHKAISSGWGTLAEATGREDVGDVAGAVTVLAHLAADGDKEALAALDGFGVDSERLLLGLFALQQTEGALDVLVASGHDLTVSVLTERAADSEKAEQATDALGRMLVRDEPLPIPTRRAARRALTEVSREVVHDAD